MDKNQLIDKIVELDNLIDFMIETLSKNHFSEVWMESLTKINISTIKSLGIASLIGFGFLLNGCVDDAVVASRNISKAADNFEIDRRIVFYNGITNDYVLSIEGRCSLYDDTNQLEVTCKTGESQYKKHFLGLSDNVTYFSEQINPVKASVYYYRVTFKPQVIIPNIDVRVGND